MNSSTTCDFYSPVTVDDLGVVVPITDHTLPFQFSSSSCVTLFSESSISSSTATTTQYVATTNGMTYGDIIMSFLLLLLVAGQFFGGILNRLIGVKRKVNNSGVGRAYDY